MTTVAIIPARGGSKGIHRKNLRLVGGMPLVGRCIMAARSARLVDDVYVSTDDDAIAVVAMRFGGKIIQRPDHLATDTASSESALGHALEVIEGRGGVPKYLVMLQCTSPFTKGAEIDTVVGALQGSRAQSAFAVVADHGFLWRIGADGGACGVNHDHTRARQRRQDRDPQYRETGAIYVVDVPAFKATGNRFCGTTLAVPVEAPAVEIDEEADLAVVDALAVVHGPVQLEGAATATITGIAADLDADSASAGAVSQSKCDPGSRPRSAVGRRSPEVVRLSEAPGSASSRRAPAGQEPSHRDR